MTPLDEGSTHRRDFYLTTHNTHKRQTFMPPVGFEFSVPASGGPQADTLDHAASGIVNNRVSKLIYLIHISDDFFPNISKFLYLVIDKTPLGRFRYSNLGGPCFLLSFNFCCYACNKTLAVEMGVFQYITINYLFHSVSQNSLTISPPSFYAADSLYHCSLLEEAAGSLKNFIC
jgi:hypothetical protein